LSRSFRNAECENNEQERKKDTETHGRSPFQKVWNFEEWMLSCGDRIAARSSYFPTMICKPI
jgi:hypothetical protein